MNWYALLTVMLVSFFVAFSASGAGVQSGGVDLSSLKGWDTIPPGCQFEEKAA